MSASEITRFAIPTRSPTAPQFNLQTALIALRCWWHVASPLGLLFALVAAGVVYSIKVDTFTASTWVWIKERPPFLLPGTQAEDPRKFVNNQIELLRSPLLLEPLAGDPAIASTPELAEEIDPVQYLRGKLKIRALGQSDYFEIAFTSRSADKAALLVNRVAHDYVALQQKQQNKSSQRTIELLQKHQLAHEKEVRDLYDRLESLSKNIHGKDGVTAKFQKDRLANPLADLQTQLILAEVEQAALAAQIQAEQELFNRESFEPAQAEIETQVQAHPRVREARDQLQASQKLLDGTKRVGVVPGRVDTKQGEVQAAQAALEVAVAEVRAALRADAELKARARKQDEIAGLQAQARRLEVTVNFLNGRLKDQRGVHQEVAGDTLQFDFVQKDYDRARQFLDAISSRILTMQTEQHAPERVEIFREAPIPTRVDEELPLKKMGMAGGAAFLVPFGLAMLLEMLFRRVSDRSQVEAVTELALVGEVTTLPRRVSARSRPFASAGRDLQLYEESIDGLRTLLSLFETTRGQRVLSVTSAVSGEGKTSLAAQLAVSIACATNRPTLLIDGDMRSPDVHRIFNVERGPGLYEVLTGQCPVEEALEKGFSENLHLLTAGELDASPHRIMGGGKFHELIDQVRGMYEFIIIDTPPILPASEALLMSSAADSAILCVRRDFSRLDQLAEASKRLRSSGVNLAGAVLSGVPPQQYAYRYGSYNYLRPQNRPDSLALEPADTQAS